MKQFVTVNQLNELSPKNLDKLRAWNQSRESAYLTVDGFESMTAPIPLLSIGDMIEFLGINIIYIENEAGWYGIKTTEDLQDVEPKQELCDALWELVKEKLETE